MRLNLVLNGTDGRKYPRIVIEGDNGAVIDEDVSVTEAGEWWPLVFLSLRAQQIKEFTHGKA